MDKPLWVEPIDPDRGEFKSPALVCAHVEGELVLMINFPGSESQTDLFHIVDAID